MRPSKQCRVIKNGQRCYSHQYVNGVCRTHALELERIKARPNSSIRTGKNPLDPGDVDKVDAYLVGSRDSAQDLENKLAELPVESQTYDQGSFSSMFPRRGAERKDFTNQRISQALTQHDLVARVQKLASPPPDLGLRPLSDPELVKYIVKSAQLSLEEARQVLDIMKASVAVGPGKTRRAMQPSSALTKTIKTRKLPGFATIPLPTDLARPKDILILISPPGVTPRVMTWRGGVHIDADLTSTNPNELSPLVAKAIQASLLWLGTKPGRTKGARILVSRIGDTFMRVVWEGDEPLNLATVRSNWESIIALNTSLISEEDYDIAMSETFGSVNRYKKRRGRPSSGGDSTSLPPAPPGQGPHPEPQVQEPEVMKATIKPRKKRKPVQEATSLEEDLGGDPDESFGSLLR